MISKEEMKSGKVEFDVILNGELMKKVDGGLLAYYDETDGGLAVMTQGVRPDFMAQVVVSLSAWLIEHRHNDLLMDALDKMLGD